MKSGPVKGKKFSERLKIVGAIKRLTIEGIKNDKR